jgi:protein N-terminal methyltransferase
MAAATAACPKLTLWRETSDRKSRESAEEQFAFAARLDAALAGATHGYLMQTDTLATLKPPPEAIDGLKDIYTTISAFWRATLERPPPVSGAEADVAQKAGTVLPVVGTDRWYGHSTWYWTRFAMTADDSGVLGGATHLHAPDEAHSNVILKELKTSRPQMGWDRALDVAAGVGRVTDSVLRHHFAKTDLVDVAPRLLEAAGSRIPSARLGALALSRMSRLQPPPGSTYDCIWMQYCLGYVIDSDLVALLKRLKACLSKGGVVIMKETTLRESDETTAYHVDAEDLNIIRSRPYWEWVFREAGLRVVDASEQTDWPETFLPVCAWVCE